MGGPIRHLYFLEVGMASMTTTFADGAQVEVGMFGYESVIGISALMGTKQSLNRVYTQIAGSGYRCDIQRGDEEFARGGIFQRLVLRYVQTQLVQAMQSAGCNAVHNFEQRLSRWLLISADRANTDQFKMSQEFLSHMLGGDEADGQRGGGTSEAGRFNRIHARGDCDPGSAWAGEAKLRVLPGDQKSPG